MTWAGRFGALAVRAQLQGALDFGQSDRYNQKWLMRENWILLELENQALLEFKRARHAQHCAGVAGDAGSGAYQHHFEKATQELYEISSSLFPWVDGQSDSASRMVELWEQEYGIKVGSEEWDRLNKHYEEVHKLLNNDSSRMEV